MQPEPERTGPAARRGTMRGILFDKDGTLFDFDAIRRADAPEESRHGEEHDQRRKEAQSRA